MSLWKDLDNLDKLFIIWAFVFQIVLIIHFALRKPFFESCTVKFGWIVYALWVPAAIISIILLLGGKSWSFWLGGFLFVIYAVFGYWVDDSIRIFISSNDDVLLVAALASWSPTVVWICNIVCHRNHFEHPFSLNNDLLAIHGC